MPHCHEALKDPFPEGIVPLRRLDVQQLMLLLLLTLICPCWWLLKKRGRNKSRKSQRVGKQCGNPFRDIDGDELVSVVKQEAGDRSKSTFTRMHHKRPI